MKNNMTQFLRWNHPQSEKFWLLCILFFSLLLKLLCWYREPVVSRDGCLYLHFIQCWYDTGSYPCNFTEFDKFYIPPLMFFLVKSLMSTGLSAETIGVSLSIALGALTPLFGYGIVYEITQKFKLAICSALLLAVNPTMNRLSVEVQRDMFFLFFAGAALWLIFAGIRRQKWVLWLTAGIMSGCAMLTRAEAVDLLGIVFIAFLVQWFTKYLSAKKSFQFVSVYFGGFFAVLQGLSVLMQTEGKLWSNYEKYFSGKMFQSIEFNLFTAKDLPE